MSHTTTTTVTKQVTGHGGTTVVTTGNREWSAPLFGCLDNCKTCLCAACCPLCFAAKLSQRIGESCCVPCCAGIIPMRVKVRLMLGIKGSVCKDCLVSEFCAPCAMCQMSRELDAAGWPQ